MKGRLATWMATRRYTSGKEEGMVRGIVAWRTGLSTYTAPGGYKHLSSEQPKTSPISQQRPSDCVSHEGVCSKAECRALMRRWHKRRMVSEEELLACNSWQSIESCSLTCTPYCVSDHSMRLLLNQNLSCFEFQSELVVSTCPSPKSATGCYISNVQTPQIDSQS